MSRRSAATEKDPYRPKLNRVSVEEEAYNNQKKYLRRIHHPDCDHLFDGLLYYRVSKALISYYIRESITLSN